MELTQPAPESALFKVNRPRAPKDTTKARKWICTLNNPDTNVCEQYIRAWKDTPNCVYATGQLEKGKEGTVHLQYYVAFDQ